MFTAPRLIPCLLASLLFAGTLPAQQAALTSKPASDKVYLDVVVSPKSGKPVAGLQQQDFTLLHNKAPIALTSFRAMDAGSEPISVIVLIDAVNATYQQVNYSRQQIDGFLKAHGGHLPHPTTLAFLTDTDTEIQPEFTTDGNAIADSLDKYTIGLRTLRRNTGFWGAQDRFQLSIKALRQLTAVESQRPGRKLILWVSPGWPLLSGPGINLDAKEQRAIFADVVDMSTQLRQSRITLYGIDPLGPGQSLQRAFYYQTYLKGISKVGQAEIADLSLQVLAVQSGGVAFTSNNDVGAMMQQCLDDATAYYEISFDPPPVDNRDSYRSLEVQVAKPGLTARTRTGYYAQP
jgi:VWFA-related protein